MKSCGVRCHWIFPCGVQSSVSEPAAARASGSQPAWEQEPWTQSAGSPSRQRLQSIKTVSEPDGERTIDQLRDFLNAMAQFVQLLNAGLWVGLWGTALLLAAVTFMLLLECVAALLPDDFGAADLALPCPSAPAAAILMPAHNEATVIGQSLQPVLAELKQDPYLARSQVWVIADNCTDDTAQLARRAGAKVLERQNSEQRGKGYALDFGLRHLAQSFSPSAVEQPTAERSAGPPQVVVMLDADCQVQPGAIAALVRAAIDQNLPIQGNYIMTLPPEAGLKDRITAFATRVKNGTRLAGLSRLGLPCLLTGTGMAFPWAALQSVSLASGDLVEDMKLGFDLVIAQHPPQFCGAATITAALPQTEAAAQSQRTRWEHGRLDLTRRYWPKLMAAGLRQGRLGPIALALDMAILPLSLLVVTWAGVSFASLVLSLATGQAGPLATCGLAGAGLALAILLSWLQVGWQVLPLGQLLLVPLFVIWKLPIYLTFLTRPQRGWVRTERDGL